MKSLKQFIKEHLLLEEEQKEIVFKKLRVPYNCPSDYYVEAPENYSESDLAIYIDDRFLNQLPGSEQNAEKFFGEQSKHIQDVHFEYDSVDQTMGKNQKADLTWDSSYDSKEGEKDVKLEVYQFKNLKYVIEFDEFKIEAESEKEAKELLDTIFNSTVSNNDNQYDITISLNPEDITFEI